MWKGACMCDKKKKKRKDRNINNGCPVIDNKNDDYDYEL